MKSCSELKVRQERIFDADGFSLRAACVCIRDVDDSESEVLLVSSSGRPDSWIIPGGKLKRDETPAVSAVREAKEEAGVVGNLGRCLGVFDNLDRKTRTNVFILKVSRLLDEFEDKDRRKRSWFSIEDALRLLVPYKPMHCKYLNAMRRTTPRPDERTTRQEQEQSQQQEKLPPMLVTLQ